MKKANQKYGGPLPPTDQKFSFYRHVLQGRTVREPVPMINRKLAAFVRILYSSCVLIVDTFISKCVNTLIRRVVPFTCLSVCLSFFLPQLK